MKQISFEDASDLSLAIRNLPKFEHSDLRPVYTRHENLYDPSLRVLEFDNCLTNRYGFLKLNTGEFINDIAYKHNVQSSFEHLEPLSVHDEGIKAIEEPIILIHGHNNYYHWHLNWLPRIVLADRFVDVKKYKILLHDKPSQFVLDSLKRVTGRTQDDIITLNGPNARLSKVFVPTMFLNPLHAPFALKSLQRCRKPRALKNRRKLYISRKKAHLRRVLNEEAVIEALSVYGFESVVAEDLPYLEQIKLFAQADFVIGAHGAGLANILFCNPDFSTIELFNEYYTRVYWSLSTVMGGKYYKQLSSEKNYPPEGETNPVQATKNADFVVDIEKLIKEVEIILKN